jgi:hypothetical protein
VFYQRLSTALAAPGAGRHPAWLILLAPELARHRAAAAAVVDRAEPGRLAGEVTLSQLLRAHRADLREEEHRERSLLTALPLTTLPQAALPQAVSRTGRPRRRSGVRPG